uniref:FoP_duplication domain-containing protein n=1 Tax=Caenorhabditis tropicalis TaxID=1561998 RepID=A0A1I7UXC3_9PELO
MVKATPLDVPLSEIISSKKRINKKKDVKKPVKRVGGGIAKRGNSSTPRRQSGGGRGGGAPIRKSFGGGPSPNEKRSVRINISNLADTVLSSDLGELFGEFNLRKVMVNFNENGSPVGTADIVLSKRDGDRLLQKFAGVALDNKVMHFAVIEASSNTPRKPEFRGNPKFRNGGGGPSNGRPNKKVPAGRSPRNQKSTRPPAKSTKKPKREPKPQKTAEELDAELDAYMSR